jgi:hypothetical protein
VIFFFFCICNVSCYFNNGKKKKKKKKNVGQVGDIVTVFSKQSSGWWKGEFRGTVGVFPQNFVRELQPTDDADTVSRSVIEAAAVAAAAATATTAASRTTTTSNVSVPPMSPVNNGPAVPKSTDATASTALPKGDSSSAVASSDNNNNNSSSSSTSLAAAARSTTAALSSDAVICLYDYVAKRDKELSFRRGRYHCCFAQEGERLVARLAARRRRQVSAQPHQNHHQRR